MKLKHNSIINKFKKKSNLKKIFKLSKTNSFLRKTRYFNKLNLRNIKLVKIINKIIN